jgi:hypothetical protein
MKIEKDVSNRIIKELEKLRRPEVVFSEFHITSLESSRVNSFPDLLITGQYTGPFLAEVKLIKCGGEKLPFRKGQPQWIEDHTKRNGKVVILVGVQASNEIYVLRSTRIRELATKSLYQAMDDWSVGELTKNWKEAGFLFQKAFMRD